MLALLIFAYLHSTPAPAQEADPPGGYRFQPPRPPPLDASTLEEEEDDDFEMGDEDSSVHINESPPMPPAAPLPGGLPPPTDARSFGGGIKGAPFSEGKLHFKVVEGKFWEKGKKRERGNRDSR